MGKEAETQIRKFAALTRMSHGSKSPLVVSQPLYIKRIIIHVTEEEPRWKKIPVGRANRIICRVGPISSPEKTAFQLLRISRVIAHHCELGGGLLVHGALVARGE